jgi:hypothetical protein
MTVVIKFVRTIKYFCGQSLSGYSTRLFLSEGEAITEEAWMNEVWRNCLSLWRAALGHGWVEDAARSTMLQIMTEACKGLRPFSDADSPEGANLLRSEPLGESPRFIVMTDDVLLGEWTGERYGELPLGDRLAIAKRCRDPDGPRM